jgi:hypothetical protein
MAVTKESQREAAKALGRPHFWHSVSDRGYNGLQMKLPPLFGSYRGWWLIVALVVGPAIILAALVLRALRLERARREQKLWQEQSRLVVWRR